jgi:hypothetical protein
MGCRILLRQPILLFHHSIIPYLVGQTVSFVALSRSYCGSWKGAKTGVQP